MTSDLDRDFAVRLRAALDGQTGPHPVWSEAPAARRVAERARRTRGRSLRLLAVAAILLVGGGAIGAILLAQPRPLRGPASNGWIAYRGDGLFVVREGVAPRRIVGVEEDVFTEDCPAFDPAGTRLAYTTYDLRFFEPTEPPHAVPAEGEPTPDPTPDPTPVPTPRLTPEPGSHPRQIVVGAIGNGGRLASAVAMLPAPDDLAACPRWSTDGRRLAYATGADRLAAVDMAGQVSEFGLAVRRTGLSRHFDFDWSPDASTIAVADGDKVWLVPTNGDDARTLPVAGAWSVRWSPDGRRLAVTVGPDVLIVTTDGSLVATVIDRDGEGPAPSWAWSPDGEWLAYVDGTKVVRVRADGSANDARPIGVPEDTDPQASLVGWSPAGDRFLVSAGGGFREPVTLLSVPVESREPAVVLVKPEDGYFGGAVSWQAAFD